MVMLLFSGGVLEVHAKWLNAQYVYFSCSTIYKKSKKQFFDLMKNKMELKKKNRSCQENNSFVILDHFSSEIH